VTDAWAFGGGPPIVAGHGTTTLLEGSTFCTSDDTGDITPGSPHGLFVADTRAISGWQLLVGGEPVERLAADVSEPFAATFVTRSHPKPGHADSALLVLRRRSIDRGMREEITVRNVGREAVATTLEMAIATDLADLFAVKEGRSGHIPREWTVKDDCLVVTDATITVEVSGSGAEHSAGVLRWRLTLAPRAEQHVTVTVAVPGVAAFAAPFHRLLEWRARSPVVTSRRASLGHIVRRGLEDLGMLRISDPDHPERAAVAAGAPWFMALFGRDSLITSLFAMPVDVGLAHGTLQMLADRQGRTTDPLSEEEPGRILHEERVGSAARRALGGGTAYYGSADATPLFVITLGELARWCGDTDEVRALIPHADAALAWVRDIGDRDGDGFVEYQRPTDRGLQNQGWKDSWDGVTFADGTLAQTPIALCEVQGYAYAAWLARADLAGIMGDIALADECRQRARDLKVAFNEAFWLPDRGWFALGLDKDKRPIDSLTSNMGHCLWTGIVDDDKAPAVAAHLVGPELFSGWGVRTLASSMTAYNPMSYHNGSVWPHDNAIAAAGLMRYGFVEEAHLIVLALLDAAEQVGGQLPELFCGFDRDALPLPVPYPTSCSPQAWAAATPLSLLRTLLQLEPTSVAPRVPVELLPLRVDGLRVGSTRLAVEVDAVGGFDWTHAPGRDRRVG
jgi:glycogen debranching enzyme